MPCSILQQLRNADRHCISNCLRPSINIFVQVVFPISLAISQHISVTVEFTASTQLTQGTHNNKYIRQQINRQRHRHRYRHMDKGHGHRMVAMSVTYSCCKEMDLFVREPFPETRLDTLRICCNMGAIAQNTRKKSGGFMPPKLLC